MSDFSLKVDFLSSYITPMHADTLWAHVCWALRYCYGEKELTDFLAAYNSDTAPLVLSNAFPKGCLPQPLLPPISKPVQMALLLNYWGKKVLPQGAAVISALARLPYLPKPLVSAENGAPLTSQGLLERILGDQKICLATAGLLSEPCPAKFKPNGQQIICRPQQNYPGKCPVPPNIAVQPVFTAPEVTMHTAVSRLTFSALTGNLFSTIEQHPDVGSNEVYCRIEPPYSEAKMKECLAYMSHTGFGRKKSTGKGRISCKLSSANHQFTRKDANAFMCLSNFIPAAGDPLAGYYRVMTKYGKLGGHFASSPVNGAKDVLPFKYPMVMFNAGSVFRFSDTPKHVYGRVVKGVHPLMRQITHYGLAFAYALQIEA